MNDIKKTYKPVHHHLKVGRNFKKFWFFFLLAILVVLLHILYSQIAYA